MIREKDPITGRLSREGMGAVSAYQGRRSIIPRLVNCRTIVASLTIRRAPVILRTRTPNDSLHFPSNGPTCLAEIQGLEFRACSQEERHRFS
jgi:hypothetical protein